MPLSFRVCFLFNAQEHQVLHGIATAVRLARKRGIEVHVVSARKGNIELAKRIAENLGGAPIRFELLQSKVVGAIKSASLGTVGTKKLTLTAWRQMLSSYEAIAVPERTSLALKRMGLTKPLFIHLDHGAGDGAVGYENRIRDFDLVLLAGRKQRERMLKAGLIRHGHFSVVGYSKFEAADAIRDRNWKPFQDDRPLVLYAPHFSALGSWKKLGLAVLDAFARQDQFNLIFAPHVRLFDDQNARRDFEVRLAPLVSSGRILVDLGSQRSVDMTYVELADIYVGDVSSQIYEFLRHPRPCLFLNANEVNWKGNESYAHWNFGPVATSADSILEAVAAARESHSLYRPIQQAALERTFDERSEPPSERAATAIAKYLRREVPTRRLRAAGKVSPRRKGLAQAALAVTLIGLGWGAHSRFDPQPLQPTLAMEADEARDEFAATMPDQRAVPANYGRLALEHGLPSPAIPRDWRVISSGIITTAAGPVVQVDAITHNGILVALIASKNARSAADPPVISKGDDERIASWSEGHSEFALAARTSPQIMNQLVSELGGPRLIS